MIDRVEVLAGVDLVEVVEGELGPPERTSGRWTFWRCPFHAKGQERTPSFGVTVDNGRFHCYGCGEHGDAISFVMRARGLGFVEACRILAPGVVDGTERGEHVAERRPVRPLPQPADEGEEEPPEGWQERGWRFVEGAKGALWRAEGEGAFRWLCGKRMLTPAALEVFGIGYHARTTYERREEWGLEAVGSRQVWLPRGIVMPCAGEGVLWSIKICRAEGYTRAGREKGEKKYVKVAGSVGGLYGYEQLVGPGQVRGLVIEEGEWNLASIWQEAGAGSGRPLVDVLGSGSASTRPHAWRRWWHLLAGYELVLVRMDEDAAGRRAWGAWRELLGERGRRAQVPRGGDPNGFLTGGGDVRGWVEWELARTTAREPGGAG